MNFKQAKEKIEKIDWYQQGAAVKPLYISYPWYACSVMKIFAKKIPVRYELLVSLKDDFMDDYLSKRSLRQVAQYYYSRQKKDAKFISKLRKHWHREYVDPYFRLNKFLLKENFSNYTDQNLLRVFQDFTVIYRDLWYEAIFMDAFDFEGENILKDALKKEKQAVKENDLEILLSPPGPSFLQKERLDILELIKRSESKPINKEALEKISGKYYWLQNDFAKVRYLGRSHFFKKYQELVKSRKKILEEQKMRIWLLRLDSRKKSVIKKYKLSKKFVNVIDFLATLGNFRDERKSYNQIAGNTLQKFAKELSCRAGLKLASVEYMFHWEIKDIFKLSRKRVSEIESRPKGWLYYVTGPGKFEAAKERQAARLSAYLKEKVRKYAELKGMPVYAGIVEGEAKIIRDQKDFHKMKKGNILVAPNTRPEFVPVMKIAAAIVTDEGGLTCHAAIVSRELKIPCIVGVQGVSFVLRDGEKIKVDSTSGIIERIK